jgi:hypothetical protein
LTLWYSWYEWMAFDTFMLHLLVWCELMIFR